MKIYSQKSEYTLLQGNMLDLGEVIEPCSIDAVLTDPPYELNFMGKGWDNSGIAFQPDTWKRCLDALKPGGYLLAFGGSRTYHRIACAIEDAGFEIRDCIMWLYGSGFPKSMNIGLAIDKKNGVDNRTGNIKSDGSGIGSIVTTDAGGQNSIKKEYEERKATNERAGWGTALKPSYEPIIVARKPLEGSCTDNVIKYGVGGINIDECRVGFDSEEDIKNYENNNDANLRTTKSEGENLGAYEGGWKVQKEKREVPQGRFPANTILTYGDDDKEEVCGGFPYTKSTGGSGIASQINTFKNVRMGANGKNTGANLGGLGDEGSAARYFYCAKASRRDRDEGLDGEGEKVNDGRNTPIDNPFQRGETLIKNVHPCVKPTDLMQYLVRLVTPNGGTVLDPFNGSGSTGKAVMYENKDRNKNYKYIGIELTDEYLPIAKARIEYVINKGIEKEKSEPKQDEQELIQQRLF